MAATRDQETQTEHEHHPPAQLFSLPTERIRGKPIERRPEKCADDIGQHEMGPGHAIGSGKDASDGAQNWYELSDENDLAAMPQEQILTELDAAFGDPQIAAIAQQQPIAEFTTYDIADHATDDRRARCSQDHRGDVEIVLGSSNNRSDDERRLPRERNTDVFQADDTGNYKQAVGVNEVGHGWHEDR